MKWSLCLYHGDGSISNSIEMETDKVPMIGEYISCEDMEYAQFKVTNVTHNIQTENKTYMNTEVYALKE